MALAADTGAVKKLVTVGDIGIAGDGTGKFSEDNVVKRGTSPERNVDKNFTTSWAMTVPQFASNSFYYMGLFRGIYELNKEDEDTRLEGRNVGS